MATETRLVLASILLDGGVTLQDSELKTLRDLDDAGWQIRGMCSLAVHDPRADRGYVVLHLERERQGQGTDKPSTFFEPGALPPDFVGDR